MMTITNRFYQLIPELLQHWKNCEHIEPIPHHYSPATQLANERALDDFMMQGKQFLNSYRSMSHKKWKQEGDQLFETLLQEDILCITKYMTTEMKIALSEVSKQFLNDALAFDETLSLSDIGQAMRNVWICMVLQKVLNQKIHYHPAIFGYSMLYPYSDNILDDPTLSQVEKAAFNRRFYQRLRGEKISANTVHEQHIFDLIACIESVYDRTQYPDVYESLYLIMDGQIKSLTQQSDALSTQALLQISAEKGAASVVADGYMVCGELDDQALSFCMQYGFMLQLGDDLQDMVEDKQNHHRTLFSIPLSDEAVEKQIKQLLVFTQQLLKDDDCDTSTKQLIIENCELLVYLSVVLRPDAYALPFLAHCRASMPISDTYMMDKANTWQTSDMMASLSKDDKKIRKMLMDYLK